MPRTILTAAALFGLAFLHPPPSAGATLYSPARLLEGERSIEALLDVPDTLSAGLHVVQCKNWIGSDGRSLDFDCYAEQSRS